VNTQGFRRGDFVAWEYREIFGTMSVHSGTIRHFAQFGDVVRARVKGELGGKKWVTLCALSHITKGPHHD